MTKNKNVAADRKDMPEQPGDKDSQRRAKIGIVGLLGCGSLLSIASVLSGNPIIVGGGLAVGGMTMFSSLELDGRNNSYSSYRDVFNSAASFYKSKAGIYFALAFTMVGGLAGTSIQEEIEIKQNLAALPEIPASTAVPLSDAFCRTNMANRVVDVSDIVNRPAKITCPGPR